MKITSEKVAPPDPEEDGNIHLLVGLEGSQIKLFGLALTDDYGRRAVIQMTTDEIRDLRTILDPAFMPGGGDDGPG